MKTFALTSFGTLLVVAGVSTHTTPLRPAGLGESPPLSVVSPQQHVGPVHSELLRPAEFDIPADTVSADSSDIYDLLIEQYCQRCHGERRQRGNLTLQDYDATAPHESAEVTEKIIRKLRAGMMPPAGTRRPEGDTLAILAATLEERIDRVALANPNPGSRTFQRLNQAEYQRSVRDLLDLDIKASDYLPLDTKSANFDNIADVQLLSPTLMDAYLNAAGEIARLAVGDPNATATTATYTNPGYTSQWERVDGAPMGTRGGVSVVHNFLADGEYVLKLAFEHTTTGGFFGGTSRDEQIEVSINGERVALLDVDRWMHVSDPNGANMRTEPIFVRAGPQRVTAAFLKRSEGPVEDLLSPHDWSLVDRQIGVSGYGLTMVAHLKDLAINGPFNPTGVSNTPSRQKIFSCRPTTPSESRPCAEEIISRLVPQAFRRPMEQADLDAFIGFFEEGERQGGFEVGIRTAIQAMLASPDFLFRFEEPPTNVAEGGNYRISDVDLASRLSFFLWGSPPDDQLLRVATAEQLSSPDVLEAQIRRMLADQRSSALGSRFAGQWLRLEDLEKVHPDRLLYPDFHQQLADAMLMETELFFNYLVSENRPLFEMLTADYSFVNERLARHYGIPNVVGEEFRRVAIPDKNRRGFLGHGSILTLTSHADRTSPVLRGKWVMEVFLGSPPPPPPPNVPDLEATEGVQDGRYLSVRERLEMHRANPACASCHTMMDPIGLALEYFDVTGKIRIKDNGVPIDATTQLYDGTPLAGPADLSQGLLNQEHAVVRNFIENLMAYALGRRVEYFDMPTIRAIEREVADNGYGMASYIMGVAKSPAFQMARYETVIAAGDGVDRQ